MPPPPLRFQKRKMFGRKVLANDGLGNNELMVGPSNSNLSSTDDKMASNSSSSTRYARPTKISTESDTDETVSDLSDTDDEEADSFSRSAKHTKQTKISADSTPGGPVDFTVFPKLVVELRLKIWEMNLEEGRIITIDDKTRLKDKLVAIQGGPEAFKERQLKELLLVVCRESRKVALKALNAYVDVAHADGTFSRIRFSSSKDTVYMNTLRAAAAPLFIQAENATQSLISVNLKHLTLHERNLYWNHLTGGGMAFVGAIARFPGLKTLIIVTGSHNPPRHMPAETKLIELSTAEFGIEGAVDPDAIQQAGHKKVLLGWSVQGLSINEFLWPFKVYKEEHQTWQVPEIKLMRTAKLEDYSEKSFVQGFVVCADEANEYRIKVARRKKARTQAREMARKNAAKEIHDELVNKGLRNMGVQSHVDQMKETNKRTKALLAKWNAGYEGREREEAEKLKAFHMERRKKMRQLWGQEILVNGLAFGHELDE